MVFEDIWLQIQPILCQTFKMMSCGRITFASIINVFIVFPLLSYAFYTFLKRIAPFRNANKAVYAMIGIVFAAMFGLFGGFIFVGGTAVSILSVAMITFVPQGWDTKKRLRVALSMILILMVVFATTGSLSLNFFMIQSVITGLVFLNILLASWRLKWRILLGGIAAAVIFFGIPMLQSAILSQF